MTSGYFRFIRILQVHQDTSGSIFVSVYIKHNNFLYTVNSRNPPNARDVALMIVPFKGDMVSMASACIFVGSSLPHTRPSMYGIFTYIWLIFMVNVDEYTIHGWYGYQHVTDVPSDVGPPKFIHLTNEVAPSSFWSFPNAIVVWCYCHLQDPVHLEGGTQKKMQDSRRFKAVVPTPSNCSFQL